MGIDSGSTSTNAVILNQNRELIASAVIRTGAKSGESAQRILKEILEKAGLQRSDLIKIVSTGYGRVSIPFADENVTEISCHGKGAHYLNPQIRTILDIGGQDSKAIHLNEKGDVTDFVMNDKCAAGTGLLEMMARTLEVDIEDLGVLSLKSTEKHRNQQYVLRICRIRSHFPDRAEQGDIRYRARHPYGYCRKSDLPDAPRRTGTGLYDDRWRRQESGCGQSAGRTAESTALYLR